ncbi:MAG TPA: hypothetical protein VGF67_20235, partial [Ktedonobacteraceae bacterium]
MQTDPTHAPTADRIRLHSPFPGDVPVVLALGRSQNHASSLSDLLGGAVPTHPFFSPSLLSLIQCQHRWFGTTHLL